jgi:hypothetical protein
MKFNTTYFHFEEIYKKGYTLDLLFLLKLVEEGYDYKALCASDIKIEALHQTLIRKGLITDSGKITTMGAQLISFMASTATTRKINKVKTNSNDFENWWKAYPGTDTFTHKGKSFSGSRSMRVKKDDCKIKFDKIILEGEYTAAEMIAALNYDVLQKKENSVKTGTNKLTFLQNSLTYLNQRSYEPFIELIKEGAQIVEAPQITGGTDI